MKKGWKMFWIGCAVTAAIGFICCAAALAMGVTAEAVYYRFPDGIGVVGDDFVSDIAGDYISGDMKESFHDIRVIDAEVSAGSMEILTSDSEDIIVETKGVSSRLKFRCYKDDDTLKLVTRKNIFRLNNVKTGEITIYIPKDMVLEEAEMSMGAGKLHIEDIHAEYLDVEVGAGQADISNFSSKEVDFGCGTGNIEAYGNAEEELNISCGIGEINCIVQGKERDYNYEIDCGIGEIRCGDTGYSGLMRNKSIDNDAEKEMDISCGIGAVTVNFENIS